MYLILRFLFIIGVYPFQWLLFKRKVYYENDKAKRYIKGGALIISNHYSALDYAVNMFYLLPRFLNVVTAEFVYENFFLRHGMKCFGGIMVNRKTKSLNFVEVSASKIAKGHIVQIFPEAKNCTNQGDEMIMFKPSYLMIALQSSSPIIPIISDHNYGIFKRVHLMVGEAIDVGDYFKTDTPTKEEIDDVNQIIWNKCKELRINLYERKKK